MKEKPILFSTAMVRAIMAGKKNQTRRVIKPRSKNACGFYVTWRKSDNAFMGVYDYDENERMFDNSQSLPYQVGDVIWVRETWQESECFDFNVKSQYAYKANEADEEFAETYNIKWRPSIFMPRKAARILLKVKDIRVERVQDITEEDAIQEGTPYELCGGWHPTYDDPDSGGEDPDFTKGFSVLWDSINEKRGYGWDTNPWVWVIEFEKLDKSRV